MLNKLINQISLAPKLIRRLGILKTIHYILYQLIKLNQNKIINTKFNIKIPFINKKIFLYYNGYAECEVVKYVQNTNNFKTFLDVGAAFGEYLLFASMNPKIRYIYGFEPIPYLYKIIKKILNLNPSFAKKIKIKNCALGDYTGSTKFYLNNVSIMYSRLTPSNSNVIYDVSINRLDDLRLKIQPPVLMLIDVEGHEIQVLKGSINFIKKYRPTIIIEVWEKNILEYEKFISKMKYKYEMMWKEKNSDTESWKLIPLNNRSY